MDMIVFRLSQLTFKQSSSQDLSPAQKPREKSWEQASHLSELIKSHIIEEISYRGIN